jgi:hypothetical protein
MGHADISGINVAIDIEIADVAMTLFADVIGEPAEGEQVVRLEEREAVVAAEALARKDFGRDGIEAGVYDL